MMFRKRNAFTLIELIIVIAISAILSAIVITFSNAGKNQVALSVETAKIAQFILRAKDVAIATYSLGSAACGYGVEFNPSSSTYSLFAYQPTSTPPCPAASDIRSTTSSHRAQFSQSTWNVPLERGIVMQSAPDNLLVVLFYPPAPAVFISTSSNGTFSRPAQTSYVRLATADGNASSTITVNPAGQVSF